MFLYFHSFHLHTANSIFFYIIYVSNVIIFCIVSRVETLHAFDPSLPKATEVKSKRRTEVAFLYASDNVSDIIWSMTYGEGG